MKTNIFIPVVVSSFLLMAFTFPISNDPINVEINTGKGSDCFSSGRLCPNGIMQMGSQGIGGETDAIGKAYFNSSDQFVLELNILLTDVIATELSDGEFSMEEDFQLPSELMSAMGRPSDVVVLNKGDYNVESLEGNNFRIVFN